MKRKFTYLLTALALLAFLSPTTAWGGVKLADTQRITQKTAHETMLGVPDGGEMTREEVVNTYVFNSKSWGATLNNEAANWTSGKDGNQYTTNQGVQVTTGVSGANATSPTSFTNISKIDVQYCTNASKGAGTIKLQVGSGSEQSFSVTKPSSGGTTLKTATFNYNTTETGSVKITVNCTENSIYIYSVAITYNDGSAPSTDPTISVNDNVIEVPSYIVGETDPAYETVTVNGSNLSANVVLALNANSDFEMSTDLETWSSSITLEQVNGSVTNEEVAVRLKAGLSQGTYNGTITLTSTDAETVTVSLSGHVNNPTYAINLTQPAIGGTIAADKETAEAGETVTLTATPATGYAFGTWTVLDGEAEVVSVTNNQFTMPASDVVVEGLFVQQDYTITVAAATNGTVECDDQTAHYGEEIMVTVTPEEGYRVASFTVAETNGTATVTDIEVDEEFYSFIMPAYNVTITVVFEVIPEAYSGGEFAKFTGSVIEEGYYIITYTTSNNANYVMKNTIASNRFQNGTFPTVNNDVISDPNGALADIVWHIEANGSYWTIFNDAVEKYAAGTNTKNQGALITEVTNLAKWSVSASNGKYEFVNLGRSQATQDPGNKYLRNNTTNGWACYANGTGGALTLYKLQVPSTDPIITVAQPTENVPATFAGESYSGTLALTYANLEISGMEDFGVQFYDEEEQELTEAPEGFEVLVAEQDPQIGEGYVVSYIVQPNSETQERVARFKVYVGEVFSNLVTITQERFVVDYAMLPFTFTGGRNDIANVVGLTEDDLGSDYGGNVSTKLKFDDTDDNLILKLNEAPTSLSYDIKGNSFSGGMFKVMVSANGSDYETLATYTELGDNQTVTHIDLASTVRYIKWVYTEKSSGNVGLGNIKASANYDIYADVTVASLTIPASKVCTVYTPATLQVTTLTNEGTYDNLIIEDGAQLISGLVQATMMKNITGTDFGSQQSPTNAGYYLIASPLAVAPTDVNNMIVTTNGDYDLYAFDPTAEMEWQNYKSSNFTLALGKGYLYANSNTTTLEFAGQLNSGFVPTNLNYVAGDDLKSLNLVGNPFAHEYDFVVKNGSTAADFNYLTLNATGDGFITNNTGDNAAVTLDPMEAILVQAPGAGYHFADPNAGDMPGIIDDGEIEGLLNISVSRNRGASVGSTAIIDNALVSFGNAPLMKKIRLSDNATELCMLQGGEEMAVVRAQGQGELPVSFRASENGTYTLSVEVNNIEMNYLHLIDNMTGADVDLLATQSYTFEAKTSDYASRFRLVFSANSVASEDACEPGFAYFNGSNWTVSNMGEATLQVVDVMGRVLSSEQINGNAEVSINQPAGVYMLRLVSGDSVKVQKVVVR